LLLAAVLTVLLGFSMITAISSSTMEERIGRKMPVAASFLDGV
jgi:hypothetical protein